MTYRSIFELYMIALLALSMTSCSAPSRDNVDPEKTKILLLGVYHFDNPGLDKHNLVIDDYFSDKRQKEIEQTVDRLSRFKPDKVLIEWMPHQQHIADSLFALYNQERLDLTSLKTGRNEVFQLGFKVAGKVGLDKLHCVDAPGNWLGPYADYIADVFSLTDYKIEEELSAQKVRKMMEYMAEHTVTENLAYLNHPDRILDNHHYYNDVAIRVKDTVGIAFTMQDTTMELHGNNYYMRSFDFENIGVDLVTEWYKRNFFVYRNILELANEQDRILLIIGQGHIRILQQLLDDNPNFEIVDPLKYLAG